MAPQPTPNQHFYAGTTAGVLSAGKKIISDAPNHVTNSYIAILYPIDLVKVRYQVYDKSGSRAYQSLASAFTTIFKQEGFTGLYQVMLPKSNR
jgi:hypothetical protein